MCTYSNKLKNPKWQKKRLEILQRDNFTCRNCGDTETTLHVHHEDYLKGKDPWDYPNEYLSTLCDECHKITHLLSTEFEKFAYETIIQRDQNESKAFRILSRGIILNLLSKLIDNKGNKI